MVLQMKSFKEWVAYEMRPHPRLVKAKEMSFFLEDLLRNFVVSSNLFLVTF